MFRRIGIELSPAAYRIVEMEFGFAGRRETRVRSYAVLAPSGPQTMAALRSLRRRRVAVVVWGAVSEHRQVVVRPGSYETMRAEALAALTAAGVSTRGMLVDIAPAAPSPDAKRRPIVVALASASAVRSAMQPLIDAGIRARTVMTPAIALSALMRSRHGRSEPGGIQAFVVLDETATSLALIKDGALMMTRALGWGYLDGIDNQPRCREDIASRLADDLAEFFHDAGGSAASVRQVCIASGLPELRSMTVPLMEQLDLEVEPLDSVFGIDTANMPRGQGDLQNRIAELRLAWAAATDWPASLNLMRAQYRNRLRVALSRAAVVGGVAAGWGIGWQVAESARWQAIGSMPVARQATHASFVAPPLVRRAPDPSPRVEPPVRAHDLRVSSAPIVRAEPAPLLPRPTLLASASAPIRAARAADVAHRVTPPLPPRADLRETTDGFDAVLGTILYSSERRLAIVDGHIVGLGDDVRGARVVEIQPTSVLLRDIRGRLRRLTLGANVR